jgi:hypothetical protein
VTFEPENISQKLVDCANIQEGSLDKKASLCKMFFEEFSRRDCFWVNIGPEKKIFEMILDHLDQKKL